MKQIVHLIVIIFIALLTFASCGDHKSVRQLPHLGNTPYQQDSVLVTYATNPKRALQLLDSALLLGNISDYRGQFIRAKIYSKSLVEQLQDSAILILKSLLTHDSVRNNATERENIFYSRKMCNFVAEKIKRYDYGYNNRKKTYGNPLRKGMEPGEETRRQREAAAHSPIG